MDMLICDKTGTLTLEQAHVRKIYSCNGLSEDMLLVYAAAAEHRQKHPVARAILAAAKERGLNVPDIEDACYQIGYGIRVNLSGQLVRVGSGQFMERRI